jgi:hypothetical protein
MDQEQEVTPKKKRGRPPKRARPVRKKKPPRTTNPLRFAVRSRARKKALQDPELRERLRLAGVKGRATAKANGITRVGIPDGWTRETVDAQRVIDRLKGEALHNKFVEVGMADPINPDDFEQIVVKVRGKDTIVLVPKTDETKANVALREAMIGVLSPLSSESMKQSYIKMVLDFTKSKPAQKTDLNVHKAEDWLDAALKEASQPNGANDDGETSAP